MEGKARTQAVASSRGRNVKDISRILDCDQPKAAKLRAEKSLRLISASNKLQATVISVAIVLVAN
jgi:hypothetical protein